MLNNALYYMLMVAVGLFASGGMVTPWIRIMVKNTGSIEASQDTQTRASASTGILCFLFIMNSL